ncbi:3-keto-disaccharide hydrolase, partial [Rhodopirellula bahusiensis]
MKTYLFAAALLSCSALLPTQKAATAEDATTSAGKWETLFDGSNLDAWREYNRESVTTGWKIDGDALTCISRKDQGEGARGENLITKEKFAAFELELDFKVTPAANSGVMFHVVETKKPP